LDICGKAITFAGRSLKDCPFRYQKLKSLLSKCVIMENIKLLSKQLKIQYMEQNVVMALINDIEEHESIKDEVTIRSLCYLSYWLYILDDDNALSIAKIIGQIEDWKNDVINACKQDCLVLCSYICMMLKDSKQSDLFWAELVDMHFGDNISEERKRINKKKWNRNQISGIAFETFDEQRRIAKNNNHTRGVIYYTFRTLSKLFWMFKTNGSEKYPKEKIFQMINERISFLKDNINNVDIRDFAGNR
jgi:hypothetical protein